MRQSKLSESKIVEILKEGEVGISIDELCRKHSISRSAYYKLRTRYGGMGITELKRLKELEKENQKLKHMYADLSLDHRILKEALEKKFPGQLNDER